MNNLIVNKATKTIDLNSLIKNKSNLSLNFQSKMIERLNDTFTNDEQNWYTMNKNIGSLEEWTCPKCSHYHDRDCNASRNILQKQLL